MIGGRTVGNPLMCRAGFQIPDLFGIHKADAEAFGGSGRFNDVAEVGAGFSGGFATRENDVGNIVFGDAGYFVVRVEAQSKVGSENRFRSRDADTGSIETDGAVELGLPVGLSPEIHPWVLKNYQGGDICLNKEKDIWLTTKEHPEIEQYIGDDIVLTDGTSVLGADDKSAIANVMTAMNVITKENRPHGDIYICFVPDEELGEKGARKLDYSKLPVDFAYTIDCCELGEVVWETFNAGSAQLDVKGVTAHPMASKGVLVNPILVLHDFINMLDRAATPEYTELREGFIVLKTVQASPA